MFVNEPLLERAAEPNALLVFVHVQRTGGSNLQRWLLTHFDADQVYSVKTVENYVHWQKREDATGLGSYRLVAGFAEFRDLDTGRPTVFLGNIRHPLYRTVSLHRLAARKADHPFHDVAVNGSFEDFYTEGSAAKPHYFHNVATRRLGGFSPGDSDKADVDLAIANIERHFGIVIPTNRLHDGTRVLTERLNWGIPPIEPGDAPPDAENYANYDDSPVRDQIIESNGKDLALFEYVTSAAGR